MTVIRNMLLLALVLDIAVQFSIQAKIDAQCRQDVTLTCATHISSEMYYSVAWYKGGKDGIIRLTLKTNVSRDYNFHRAVRLDDQYRLVLLKVTPEDSGRYHCHLGANVDKKNMEVDIELTVSECGPDETTVSIMTTEPEKRTANRTNCTERSDSAALHLSLTLSFVSYGAVALTKILMSAIIIWSFHVWMKRKRRW